MSRYGWVKLPVLAAGLYLASAFSAGAQTASLLSNPAAGKAGAAANNDGSKYDPSKFDPWASTRPAEPTDDVAETTATPVDTSHDDDLKDIDVDKLDWSQLGADAATLATHQPGKTQSAAKAPANAGPNWSSNNNDNGSSAVSVKESLAGFLDPQVGADMTVAQQPQSLTESQILAEKLANGGSLPEFLRLGLGVDQRPRRRRDLGQNLGAGSGRSRPGSEPARDLLEQVDAAQWPVLADAGERL